MKYFLDAEFLEGPQTKSFLGIKTGQTKPTVDLISIGIVAEDGREYYAISKDFNLKEAWNRYDLKKTSLAKKYMGFDTEKVYWIRENVLKPIEIDLFKIHCKANVGHKHITGKGDYKALKWLLETYGKTNKQIAEEVKEFVSYRELDGNVEYMRSKPQFYAYYADYDWVAFCWLFGNMINLPKGFPMYCIDLKQELDNYISKAWKDVEMSTWGHEGITLEELKQHSDYPKQTNEHNALTDAKWNKELYEFIKKL